MQRKRLVASVAAIPLLTFACGAWAETTVTTAVTTPVTTSDPPGAAVNDDVRVTSTGSIKPTVAGAALLMDSNNDITNEGQIATTDVNDAVGMQGAGGLTGDIVNKGSIAILEDYTATDSDASTGGDDPVGDGDLDGPFAKVGSIGRFGIRVTEGAGVFTGSVTNDTAAIISIEGNQSTGIGIEADMTGNLIHRGSVSVVGDGSYGIRTTGAVTGSLDLRGGVNALGEDAVGVSVEDTVTGVLRIQGAVSARGYRGTSHPTNEAFLTLDADDLLQGGGGVIVTADVDGGILLDAPPAYITTDTDTDEDDDGVDDSQEGVGSITVHGRAPALLIGSSAGAVEIGAVGTGDNAYGLVLKAGQNSGISANGVYDDVSATAIQIGSDSVATATLAGGVSIGSTVSAVAYDDDATALRLTRGAVLGAGGAGQILNSGTMTAQTTAKSGPAAVEEGNTARAISVEAGASVAAITNTGALVAIATGEDGSAIVIQDSSNTVRTITNKGIIQAIVTPTDPADGPSTDPTAGTDTDDADEDPGNEVITGRAIVIDVRASTTGVTVIQDDRGPVEDDERLDSDDDGIANVDEPQMQGEILFGSGDDVLQLDNGFVLGKVDFGTGADDLKINGGAYFEGQIMGTAAGSDLDILLNDGTLFITETDIIHGSSLNVGADGTLIVAINPEPAEDDLLCEDMVERCATRFVVDNANFAAGSKIGVTVQGLLDFAAYDSTNNYLIVDAGTLTSGAIDESLLGSAPYIYVVGIDANTTTGEVSLAIRRRRSDEAGMNAAEGVALNAVYDLLGVDEDLQDALLRQVTREGFLGLYDQLLPDQGEGLFSALDMGQISIARAIAAKPDLRRRYGPDSVWIQELNLQVKRDGGETLGSEAKAFGFVAGYESMGADGGALGATLAYLNVEENDDAAKVGEQTTVSQVEAGVYWRRAAGAWLFSARGGAGYAWFDGTRRFISPPNVAVPAGLIRESDAQWSGWTASAHLGAQYEQKFGRFYARPGLFMDYFYLNEAERQEEGGGEFDQSVEARTSYRLSGTAEVAFGAEFGRDVWWRPEVRLGYRQVLAGEIGDTVASFSSGNPFTLVAMEPGNGAAIVALALKMGTPMSYLALEGEMEAADGEQRYNLKLTGRVMF